MTQRKAWEETVEWVGIVAGCVILQDGKYLLVQEKQPKVYGLWNLPAGYVDKGETIEQAAMRETKEESGYDVELVERIGVYHNSVSQPIKHVFRAHIVGGNLQIKTDEILDGKWLTYAEITQLNHESKLRADFIFDAITKVANA